MADTTIDIGSTGIQKKLHENIDGTYSDTVYVGGLAAGASVDLVAADLGVANEAAALGPGMLIQGDDGTDRHNIQTDTDGHLQVDVLSMVANVDLDIEAADLGAGAAAAAMGVGVTQHINNGAGNRVAVLGDVDGHLQVDVIGGAITAETELTLKDFDTTGLTSNVAVVGLVVPSATGPLNVPGDGTDGLKVQLPAGTVTTLTPPAAITGFATSAKQLADGHNVTLIQPGTAVGGFHNEVDAVAAHEIIADPGALKAIHVTQLIVTNDATAPITVKLVTDTGGGAAAITPTYSVAASGTLVIPYGNPGVVGTTNKNVGFTTVGTSNYTVQVIGYSITV